MTMPSAPAGTDYGERSTFLISMYEQLMEDINRHIVVVWQMVGVLTAAIAGLVLAQKEGVPTAYAAILLFVVTAWVLDHVYDSNFWYNRNLVMITNIERVFLTEHDIDYIHPYFAAHRKAESFLQHLAIMRNYALVIATLMLFYFIVTDVVSTWEWGGKFNAVKSAPFAAYALLVWRNFYLRKFYNKKYADYLAISPGIQIRRTVDFGGTHGKK